MLYEPYHTFVSCSMYRGSYICAMVLYHESTTATITDRYFLVSLLNRYNKQKKRYKISNIFPVCIHKCIQTSTVSTIYPQFYPLFTILLTIFANFDQITPCLYTQVYTNAIFHKPTKPIFFI